MAYLKFLVFTNLALDMGIDTKSILWSASYMPSLNVSPDQRKYNRLAVASLFLRFDPRPPLSGTRNAAQRSS